MPPRKTGKDKEEPRARTRTTSTPRRITRVRFIGEPGAIITGTRGSRGKTTIEAETVRKTKRAPSTVKETKARRAKRTKTQKEEGKGNLKERKVGQKKQQRQIAGKKEKRTRRST